MHSMPLQKSGQKCSRNKPKWSRCCSAAHCWARSFRCQAASHGLLKQVSQRGGIKGLVQYSQIWRGRSRSIAVPRGQDHLQVWIARPDLTREANSVDRPGHDDVAKNKIYVRPFRQELQRRFSRLTIDRIIAEVLKQRRCYLRNLDTVVNDEDHRTLRMSRVDRGNLFLRKVLAGTAGQINANRRSMSDLACRPYNPAGLVGKPIYLR